MQPISQGKISALKTELEKLSDKKDAYGAIAGKLLEDIKNYENLNHQEPKSWDTLELGFFAPNALKKIVSEMKEIITWNRIDQLLKDKDVGTKIRRVNKKHHNYDISYDETSKTLTMRDRVLNNTYSRAVTLTKKEIADIKKYTDDLETITDEKPSKKNHSIEAHFYQKMLLILM